MKRTTHNKIIAVADAARSRYGQFSSPHEIVGVLEEEFMELKLALHANNWDEFRRELIDIAAVCFRGTESTAREDSNQL